MFEFDEVITLYDITNTFFEGTGHGNTHAELGHSKEKRTDCPLVTLALVLDGSGFPKRSEVFAGNVSEPKTLAQRVGTLVEKDASPTPTVVLDAGIATEENIAWLIENQYHDVGAAASATVELKRADGKTLHIRKTSRAEPRQQRIYDALGISDRPGKTQKTII